jgi:hypothetical protein
MSEETDIKDTDLIASLEALVVELKREDVSSPSWAFVRNEDEPPSLAYNRCSYRISVSLYYKEPTKRLAQ